MQMLAWALLFLFPEAYARRIAIPSSLSLEPMVRMIFSGRVRVRDQLLIYFFPYLIPETNISTAPTGEQIKKTSQFQADKKARAKGAREQTRKQKGLNSFQETELKVRVQI